MCNVNKTSGFHFEFLLTLSAKQSCMPIYQIKAGQMIERFKEEKKGTQELVNQPKMETPLVPREAVKGSINQQIPPAYYLAWQGAYL